jgi:hypothetical protein
LAVARAAGDAVAGTQARRWVAPRKAAFSPCGRYRYTLWRDWGGEGGKYALFVCLNPSTADDERDDPTVRRCIAFADAWGYRRLCVANLFALRATDPAALLAAADPVGPDNDAWLRRAARGAAVVVAAWGNRGARLGRDGEVLALLPRPHFLRLTVRGRPEHPLRLPRGLTPRPWPQP